MFSLQLLGSSLANHVLLRIQMPLRGTAAVGVKTANAQWCEQGFQFQKCPILTATADIRQHPARLMIQRLPEPPWLLLATDKRPHLIQVGLLHLVRKSLSVDSPPSGRKGWVPWVESPPFVLSAVRTVVGLTPSTWAGSQMPPPFSARSTICRLISGTRPLS
jgi:hypothetical protein